MRDEYSQLAGVGLLFGMSAPDCATLLDQFRRRQVPAGQTVLAAAGPVNEAYLVVSGRALVRRPGSTAIVAGVTPGGVFGEIELLTGSSASLEVVADSELVLLGFDLQLPQLEPRIRRQFFKHLARELAMRVVARCQQRLPEAAIPRPACHRPWREAPLLRDLTSAQVDFLVQQSRPMTFLAGEAIVRESALGAPMLYLVRSGQGSVYMGFDDQLIDHVGAGDVVGELGFLTGASRTATVRADSELELLAIPLGAIEAHVPPEIYRNLAACLVARLPADDQSAR